MRALICFGFLLSSSISLLVNPAAAAGTPAEQCMSRQSISGDPTAIGVLCGLVRSNADLTSVMDCYLDGRLQNADAHTAARLCRGVKNRAEREAVVGCYFHTATRSMVDKAAMGALCTKVKTAADADKVVLCYLRQAAQPSERNLLNFVAPVDRLNQGIAEYCGETIEADADAAQ